MTPLIQWWLDWYRFGFRVACAVLSLDMLGEEPRGRCGMVAFLRD